MVKPHRAEVYTAYRPNQGGHFTRRRRLATVLAPEGLQSLAVGVSPRINSPAFPSPRGANVRRSHAIPARETGLWDTHLPHFLYQVL